MVIAEVNILAKFYTFNEQYFGGVLPLPEFKVTNSYRTLGYFHCQVDDYGNYYNEVIEMSGNYDYTFEQFRDVLIHEMIHYYLLYMGIDRRCSHGKHFKRMCKQFNSMYGMNLTKRIDLTDFKLKEGKSKFMFELCTFI